MDIKKSVIIFICLLLAVIPFFWLKPGEIDIGGDSSRLYFYNPLKYIQSTVLYSVQPFADRPEESYVMFLPFILILGLLNKVISSPTLIITLFNSLKLVLAFFSIYTILTNLLKSNNKNTNLVFIASILAGLFYTFSPVMMRASWDKAIMSQSQFFLNPVMFYFLLKYILTKKMDFLLYFAIVSVIFSGNFSWGAAPPFFAFYPISIIYLLLYAYVIEKTTLPIKKTIIWIFLLFAMHLFHILPFIIQLLNKSGTVFGKSMTVEGVNAGLSYFLSEALRVGAVKSWLSLPQAAPSSITFDYIFFYLPILIVIAFFINSKKNIIDKQTKRNFLLLLSIFLIVFYFTTANVTNLGLEIYKAFFNIPGFLMFRNFYGQWMYVYTFFYSILLGYSLFYIFKFIRNIKAISVISIMIILTLFISSYGFIKGDMINIILNPEASEKFKVPLVMDKEYENFLSYVENLPSDGKFISLPYTETYYQMLAGTNNGIYQGPSTLSYIANKADFVGYQTTTPYSERIIRSIKDKNYSEFLTILAILNVKYIYYNSDPRILENFKFFPYQHVKDFLPTTNDDYEKLLTNLQVKSKKSFGKKYHIYELNSDYYLPHIYTADYVSKISLKKDPGNQFIIPVNTEKTQNLRPVFSNDNSALGIKPYTPKIIFERVNATHYRIEIQNAKKPFILVFQDRFNNNWKLYSDTNQNKINIRESYFGGEINEGYHSNKFLHSAIFSSFGKQEIANKNHILANGYANGWLITPDDLGKKSNYFLKLEMISQGYIYIGLIISLISISICLIWIAMLRFSYKNR